MRLKLFTIFSVLCFQFGFSQEIYLKTGKTSLPMIIKIRRVKPIAILKVAQEALTNWVMSTVLMIEYSIRDL